MKKVIELLKVYLLDLLRRPANLFFTFLMVLGVLGITGFVLNQGTTAEIVASYSVFIASYASMWMVSQSIPGDRQKGLYRMYRSSKLSKLGYVSSKLVIASLSLLLSLLVIAVGYFASSIYLTPLVVPVLLLSLLAHTGLGIVVASYSETSSEAQTLASVFLFAMLFLAPVFYTPEDLPRVVQLVQKLVPLTYGVEAMRALMVDGSGLHQVRQSLALLSFLGTASFTLGYRKLEF